MFCLSGHRTLRGMTTTTTTTNNARNNHHDNSKTDDSNDNNDNNNSNNNHANVDPGFLLAGTLAVRVGCAAAGSLPLGASSPFRFI